MNGIDELAKTLAESSDAKEGRKTKSYDTSAKVVKVEGKTAWVAIPGGVEQTPAAMAVAVKTGDEVRVRVSGGKAYVLGNISSPPTDDSYAKQAEAQAIRAMQAADSASDQATRAQRSADSSVKDAETARASADNALKDAATAQASAESAVEDAAKAQDAAESAQADATTAKEDAATAKANAQTAIADAAAAASAAGQAQTSAQSAQSSANGALKGLSTVQDVIGVLDWAKDNATYTLTSDTDIVPGKTYWTRSGSGTEADPYTYTPVVTPVKADLGTYYEISGIDEAMADYINTHLALTDEGLYVLGGANQWKVLIATDGVYIIDGTSGVDKVVAKYKDAITLGLDDGSQSYIYEDYHSLQMFDKESASIKIAEEFDENKIYPMYTYVKHNGRYYSANTLVGPGEWKDSNWMEVFIQPYVYFSDLRGIDGKYEVTETLTSSSSSSPGVSGNIYPTYKIGNKSNIVSISYNGNIIPPDQYSFSDNWGNGEYISFANSLKGVDYEITYKSIDQRLKAFTLGIRSRRSTPGFMSCVIGDSSYATGHSSIAIGQEVGASGEAAYAEGYGSKARGKASHAQNYFTEAVADYQTVIGKYNTPLYNKAFIIGNGYTDQNTQNALTVDWKGGVEIALDTDATSGTDKEIYDALIALGWASDVIG